MNPTIPPPPPPPPPPPYGMPPYQGPPGQYHHVHSTGGCAGMVQNGCRNLVLLGCVAFLFLGWGCWQVSKSVDQTVARKADWVAERATRAQEFVRRLYPNAMRVDFSNLHIDPETPYASNLKFTYTAWITSNYAERSRLFFLWDKDYQLKEVIAIWNTEKFFPLREHTPDKYSKQALPERNGVSHHALAWLEEQAKGRYEMREMKWEALICPNVYACTVSFETVAPDGKVTPQKFRFVVNRRIDEMVAVDNLLTGKSFLRSENENDMAYAKIEVPDFVP